MAVSAICVAIGLLLMTAALLKAASPKDTVTVLRFVFGEDLAKPLLYALLSIEIPLASILLIAARPRVSLLLASVLFMLFLAWIGYLEINNAPVSCGCGIESKHWLLGDGRLAAALRAGSLFVLSFVGFLISPRNKRLNHSE